MPWRQTRRTTLSKREDVENALVAAGKPIIVCDHFVDMAQSNGGTASYGFMTENEMFAFLRGLAHMKKYRETKILQCSAKQFHVPEGEYLV
jgi:hypothetical protein